MPRITVNLTLTVERMGGMNASADEVAEAVREFFEDNDPFCGEMLELEIERGDNWHYPDYEIAECRVDLVEPEQ